MNKHLLEVMVENAVNKSLNENKDSLKQFFREGKSINFKGEYDSDQLRMGIKVEMEHTNDPEIAKKIAMDHLAEFKYYYTHLAEMEKKLKEKNKN